jgi:plastocyanin
MIAARTLAFAGATLVLLPALMGLKCVDYDTRFAGSVDPPAGGASGDGAAGETGSVTPAKACANPEETIFQVSNYAFNIQCGCVESKGKICTVPVGTTVKWQFVDSTSHNVTSIANSFGGSPDTSAGVFQKVFATAGSYRYGCSIHAFDMSGYRIEVR